MLHFVLPFYNSELILAQNALAVHDFLARELPGGFELVLCDDGSRDGSRTVARSLEKTRPAIRVVGYDDNRGRGYAVRFAAQTCSGEYLIFADLDLPQTTSLGHILEMTARLRPGVVVIGSRFLRDSKTRRLWLRSAIGRAHRVFVRARFPSLGIRDPDAGFKGFDLAVLKSMSALCREDRWSWDLEILVIARANGVPVAEIPIDWDERHDAYATSVSLVRASWEEFSGMGRIRRNLKAGRYRL